MRRRERSPQQIDPLGALSAGPITLLAAVASVVYAVVMTLVTRSDLVSWPLAGLSLAALVAAGAVLVIAAHPSRAPFGRRSVVVLVVLLVVTAVLSALSTAGQNGLVRDDWLSLSAGVLLLGLAPYRPGREIAVAGIVTAAAVGVVVVFEVPSFVTDVPGVVFVVVAMTPVIALAFAGAAFSAAFVTLVEGWIERASSYRRAGTDDLRARIARSVQQDRVTILNRDVVPFFSGLVEAGVVTADDSRRARAISDTLRGTMVAEADRTWLEQLLSTSSAGVRGVVADPGHVAGEMTTEHRTALRALLVAFADTGVVAADDVSVVLRAEEARVHARITVATTASDLVVRHRLTPYFAVLRVVFDDLHVDPSLSLLTLRFSYDQH